jgi:hypothetical protein
VKDRIRERADAVLAVGRGGGRQRKRRPHFLKGRVQENADAALAVSYDSCFLVLFDIGRLRHSVEQAADAEVAAVEDAGKERVAPGG